VHLLPVHPIMLSRLEQMLLDPSQDIRSYDFSRGEQTTLCVVPVDARRG
jgi:hypothetical protein